MCCLRYSVEPLQMLGYPQTCSELEGSCDAVASSIPKALQTVEPQHLRWSLA
jgi:hypothetical protein